MAARLPAAMDIMEDQTTMSDLRSGHFPKGADRKEQNRIRTRAHRRTLIKAVKVFIRKTNHLESGLCLQSMRDCTKLGTLARTGHGHWQTNSVILVAKTRSLWQSQGREGQLR